MSVERLDVRELTPSGAGAVSVVRARGASALAVVAKLACRPIAVGELAVARLVVAGEMLDEALVVARASDEVEIHVHGSPVVVRELVARLNGGSERLAPLASSSDLHAGSSRDRARALLSHACCDAAARLLLDQSEGAFEHEVDRLATLRAPERERATAGLVERGRIARFVLEPVVVVLAGPPNAGKSTLFNALVGEHRALVSDLPGTTRDVVRASTHLGAYPIELVDTAGEREASADPLEQLGIELAREQRTRAAWVVWLSRGDGAGAACPERENLVHVRSCVDVEAQRTAGAISALHAPRRAREVLHDLFVAQFALPRAPWQAGAAVPFDPQSRELAARLARAARDDQAFAAELPREPA